MHPGFTALGIASLLVWGGLWFYLFTLQKRLDALEEDHEAQR
jgi:hypothetical protein